MKHNSQVIRIILVVLALFLSPPAYTAQLMDLDGKVRSLNEFTGKGQWVVVMLWHSTCRISNAVVHEYVDFHTFHSDNNATVLGVSLDGYKKKKDAIGFIDKHEIKFFNLIGDYDEIVAMVESHTGAPWGGTPTFMIYSPKGKLRAVQSGGVPANIIENYIAEHSLPNG